MYENLRGVERTDKQANFLYHYTNNTGLIGILNSKSIWMTDINYLNDHQEYKHFLKYLEISYQEKSATMSNQMKHWTQPLLDDVLNPSNLSRIFVASFSENSDSLGQWRGYSEGRGFNLRFKRQNLRKV